MYRFGYIFSSGKAKIPFVTHQDSIEGSVFFRNEVQLKEKGENEKS